jgi:hypothetical protein
MPIVPEYTGSAFAHETLTVSTAVKTLTAATYEPTGDLHQQVKPRAILVTVHAQPLRYTFDGTNPVAATTGHYAAAGAEIFIGGYQNIKNFKAIRDGGTDSSIGVTYFK